MCFFCERKGELDGFCASLESSTAIDLFCSVDCQRGKGGRYGFVIWLVGLGRGEENKNGG